MTCEWCGASHEVKALCQARPQWSRRGFLALAGVGIVSATVPFGQLAAFAPPSEEGPWHGRLEVLDVNGATVYAKDVELGMGVTQLAPRWDIERTATVSSARLDVVDGRTIRRFKGSFSPEYLVGGLGNTLTIGWPITIQR